MLKYKIEKISVSNFTIIESYGAKIEAWKQ
jgi:hypothetical protein